MKILLNFFLLLASQILPAQNWLILEGGEKVEAEYVSRAANQVEYVEKGDWKVLPLSSVKRICYLPGKYSLNVSYSFPMWRAYSADWIRNQEPFFMPDIPEGNEHLFLDPDLDLNFSADFELRARPRWGVGGLLGYHAENGSVGYFIDSKLYYESLIARNEWHFGQSYGYAKWYNPVYNLFISGGIGIEWLAITFDSYYTFERYYSTHTEYFFKHEKFYRNPVLVRPSVFLGGGICFLQMQNHTFSMEAESRYSGSVPAYYYELETRTLKSGERVLLFSVFLQITYSFKFN